MPESILKKNNMAISSADEMHQICSPLKKHFDIENFQYLKIFPDMSRIHLGMNAKWNEFYYAHIERYYKEYLTEGYHWSSGCSPLLALGDACIEDAIAHETGDGVLLTQHNQGCTEMFFITHKWSQYKSTKVELLMRNIDLIEMFIASFKEKAKDLIALAAKDPIFLPFIKNNQPMKQPIFSDELRRAFIMDLNKLENKSKLTSREVECIYYTSLNMSAKQVAEKLRISPRTVEHHLDNAKNKIGCSKKSSLIAHLVPRSR